MFCKNCGSQVPEGTAFCASCGAPVVNEAPAAAPEAPAVAPASNKSNLIKLIAIIAAAAIVIGILIAIFAGGSAESVAKKYVEAEIMNDIKTMYNCMPGDYLDYLEEETEDEDEMFEYMEEVADEFDIDAKIDSWNDLYKTMKKIGDERMKEQYGDDYKIEIEVKDVEDMRSKELKEIQERYEDNEDLEDYVDADKIKDGKIVTVHVYINGEEGSDTEDLRVNVVKYGMKWKVVGYNYDD